MFGWREGEVGLRMAALLERKLSEGVEVRVIVDGLGSRPYMNAREMFTRLAGAGAEIVVNDVLPPDRVGLFPAGRPVWRLDQLGRADHRKLYVIDGNVAWTGGAGIEDHFNDGRFHDLMVRVTGDVVRQAQAAFLTSFRGNGGPLPAELSRHFPAPREPGATPIALTQVIPGGFVAASEAVREQIDQARERLDVMNPYLTDPDIVEQVLAAARRGVRVRVVVSETLEQPCGVGGAEAPVRGARRSRGRGVGGAGHGRPRQGGGRRRCRQLRHAQPRRVGAVPQLGADDDRQEPGDRGARAGAAVRARRRAFEARPTTLADARAPRELARRQAHLLPVTSSILTRHG